MMVLSDVENKSFNFIQMNLWRGRLYYPITNLIETVKPDILSMQEVFVGQGSSKPDYMTANMMLDQDHQYFDSLSIGGLHNQNTPVVDINGDNRLQCCATAFKEPFKTKSKKIIPINEKLSIKNKTTPYRSLLLTTVSYQKTELHILNLHNFVNYNSKANTNERNGGPNADYQMEQVCEIASDLRGGIIFSGDLNLNPTATSFKTFEKLGLINLNIEYSDKIKEGRNQFSWNAKEIVSHVFVNQEISVNDYYAADDYVSDHKALVMNACFKNNSPN